MASGLTPEFIKAFNAMTPEQQEVIRALGKQPTQKKTAPTPVGIRIPETPLPGGTTQIGGGLYSPSPPGAATTPTATPQTSSAPRVDFATQARLLYPGLAEPILNEFIRAWEEYGDPNLALAKVRQSAIYEQYYAGNRRPDGTVRLSEMQYASNVEGFNRRRAAFGMTALSQAQIKTLMEGDVSPELYGQRLNTAYVGLIGNIGQVKEYYATNYGAGGLSDAALFQSFIDKTDPLVAQRELTAAQLGGEAKVRGFNLARAEAERLTSFGLDQQAGRTLFGQAQQELPKLNDLIQRHNDPNDDFTLDSYAEAIVLNDPEELARIGRLYGQERSLYSSQNLFARDQSGGLVGLLDR